MKIIKIIYLNFKLENKPEIIIFSILSIYSFFYILLHALHVLNFNLPSSNFSTELYRVTYDHSYGEFFQYQTLLGACIVILFLSLKELKYLFFFPFFLCLLLDDYFRLHDNYSVTLFKDFELIIKIISEVLGIRKKDIFEIFWHFISLFFFIISLLILFFKDNGILLFLKKYVFAVTLLVFFALFVDIVGVKITSYIDTPRHYINTLIYFLEEGGEMITCSYLFSILFGQYLKI